MYKKLLISSFLLLAYNAEAKEPSRFELMDANSDKFVDYNEFSLANPNFSKMAYDIIDSNKDNKVNLEEWDNFLHKHSTPEGVKLDVEKRKTLKAKEKPDDPKMPTMPTIPPMQEVSSPNAVSIPTNSSPNAPAQKQMLKQAEVAKPSVKTVSKPLPLLKPIDVKAPEVKQPNMPSVKPVQEPSVPKNN